MSDLRRRRLRKARQAKQRRTHLWLIACGALVALVTGAVLVSALAVDSVSDRLRDGELKEIRLGQNSRIYDKNGRELGIIAGVTNRTVVPGGRIPKVMRDATVAIEDKRFYDHDGVDYYRLVGAAVRDLESGAATQGGSTITMQLAKNLTSPSADRTISKKLEEVYLAYQYEKQYTKNQILARYLNGVFYGQNAIGVQAASLTYFDEDVWEITLPQAALLAGLPQAPTAYNPFEYPEDARARRNVVLEEMADQGFITHERADQAKQAGPRPQARPGLQAQARGVLLRVRPPGPDRPLRGEAGPERRLQGLHDHRPGAAVGGPARHPGEPLLRRRPRRRRGHG